jgi:hypothetical protein
MKRTDLVLSASAMAAAIGALNQVAQTPTDEGGAYRITVSAKHTIEPQHKDAIAASLSNTAIQYLQRQTMAIHLNAMDVDKETLEKTWLRIAQTNANIAGTGAMYGPLADSTISEPDGVGGCYTNCHSACHGSRGWR